MDFSQIQQLWTQQPGPAPAGDDVRMDEMAARARRLSRRVRTRDYVELVTAAVMAAAFGGVATQTPVAWPWVAAAIITLGVGAVFVRERLRSKYTSAGGTDVRSGLELAIAEADHQIRLLGSVASWYLAPLGLVAALICIGVLLGVREAVGPDTWARGRAGLVGAFAVALVVTGGAFWLVWKLNLRAVNKTLLPYREELAVLRGQLEESEDEGEGL
jgi:hypothetical protein